jgi:predicted metal-dependent hydrolase
MRERHRQGVQRGAAAMIKDMSFDRHNFNFNVMGLWEEHPWLRDRERAHAALQDRQGGTGLSK